MGMRMCFMLLSLCVYFVGIPASYSSNSVFNIKNEASGSSSLAGDVANVIHQSHLNFMNLKGRSSSADNIKLAVVFLPDVDKEYGTNDASAKNILFEKTCSPSEWPISASEITKDIYEGCIWNRGGEPCHDADGEHYSCWSCQNGWTPVSPSFRLGGGCVAVDLDCHAHKLSEQMDTSKGDIEKKWSRGEEVWCYTNCNTEDGWIAKHDNKGYISDCVANDCSDYPMDGSNITCIDGNRKLCGGKAYIYCKKCIEGYRAVNGVCIENSQNDDGDDNADDIEDDDLLTKLLKRFRKIINFSENGETEKVLRKQFQRATSQNLRTRNNFPVVMDYFGNKEDKDLALEVMASWLFAMTLTEVDPSKRDELYRVGYVVGKDEPTYGRNFDSDLNIARLTASAIYAKNHDFDEVKRMRAEIGSYEISYAENNFPYIDLMRFMPSAPGPYDIQDRSNADGKPGGDKNGEENLVQDQQIHEYIVKNYNLPNQRAIQAVADKEMENPHIFGPSRTVVDERYGTMTFNPVFGKHNIGIEIDPDSTLAKLAYHAGDDCTTNKDPFMNIQLGRKRPGKDKSGNESVLRNWEIEFNDGNPTEKEKAAMDPAVIASEANGGYEERKALVDAVYGTSYPSGHSAHIWCIAMTLMEVMPDKTAEIMKAANEYAMSRTIARYHWTSDTIHGRVIGSSFMPIFFANPDNAAILEKVKNEIENNIGGDNSCAGYFDQTLYPYNLASCTITGGTVKRCPSDPTKIGCDCSQTGLPTKANMAACYYKCSDTFTNKTYFMLAENYKLVDGQCIKDDSVKEKCSADYKYTAGSNDFNTYCANKGGKAIQCAYDPSKVACDCTGLSSSKIGNCKTHSECPNTMTGTTYYKCNACADGYEPNSAGTECVKKEETTTCDENLYPYTLGARAFKLKCENIGGTATHCEHNYTVVGCDCTGLSSSKIDNCKTQKECLNTSTNTTYYKCNACADGYEPNSTGTECVKKEETCDVNQYPYGGEQIVSKCTDHGGKNEACKKADNVWRHGCHCEDSTFSTKKSVANCKIYDTCTDTFKNNTKYYKCTECAAGYDLKGGACYADTCNSCSGDACEACCHKKCGGDYGYHGMHHCWRTVPSSTAPAGITYLGDRSTVATWKCETKNPEEEDKGNDGVVSCSNNVDSWRNTCENQWGGTLKSSRSQVTEDTCHALLGDCDGTYYYCQNLDCKEE